MSGRVLFTVAVMAVFVGAIVYMAWCARAEARDAAANADVLRPTVTDEALAQLLDDATATRTAA